MIRRWLERVDVLVWRRYRDGCLTIDVRRLHVEWRAAPFVIRAGWWDGETWAEISAAPSAADLQAEARAILMDLHEKGTPA